MRPDQTPSPASADAEADAALRRLLQAPAPRRTDDAFARTVADRVAGASFKRRAALSVGVLATCAATAFVLVPRGPRDDAELLPRVAEPTETPSQAPPNAADAAPVDAESDDVGEEVLALLEMGAPGGSVSGGAFALPNLDGSSDDEVERLEGALDAALAHQAARKL